jgi:hypothetical protein
MSGQGTLLKPDGTKEFTGEFVKDLKMNGVGEHRSHANGPIYSGQIKNGKYNGQGTLTYSNKESYVGEFKNGLFNGRGVTKKEDGTFIFVGEFRDGQPWTGSGEHRRCATCEIYVG